MGILRPHGAMPHFIGDVRVREALTAAVFGGNHMSRVPFDRELEKPSLRDEAITHMEAEIKSRRESGFEPPEDYGDWGDARAALDALLDFLDAHTEEWDEAVPSAIGVSVKPFGLDKAIRFLVAALRGTTEESVE